MYSKRLSEVCVFIAIVAAMSFICCMPCMNCASPVSRFKKLLIPQESCFALLQLLLVKKERKEPQLEINNSNTNTKKQ